MLHRIGEVISWLFALLRGRERLHHTRLVEHPMFSYIFEYSGQRSWQQIVDRTEHLAMQDNNEPVYGVDELPEYDDEQP